MLYLKCNPKFSYTQKDIFRWKSVSFFWFDFTIVLSILQMSKVINNSITNVDYAKLLGTQLKGLGKPNESYVKDTETISQLNDDCFPKTKFKIKSNNKANLWITKGIAKSFKHKQKLHQKFLKTTLFKMKKSIRTTGNILKERQWNQNGNTTVKNYCNFKVTPKNMANYKRSDWKI